MQNAVLNLVNFSKGKMKTYVKQTNKNREKDQEVKSTRTK